jgi:23S rRNA pseudouridine955/2504/2580 synthase
VTTIDSTRLRRVAIIEEDDQILAVNKPPGLAVHGGAGLKQTTLIELLESAYPESTKLHPVHRIDRGTSGLVLVAKSAAVARAISQSWSENQKTYLALVDGHLSGPMEINEALPDPRGRMKSASTRLRIESKSQGELGRITLVRVDIDTGRMHQIRRHLAQRGHPILLDDKYGDFRRNRAFRTDLKRIYEVALKHMMLHSWQLTFVDPGSNKRRRLVAEIPSPWPALFEAVRIRRPSDRARSG